MKLENKEFGFDSFAAEMAKLKNEKHFDYLVTVVGEDFGAEEGLGCIYILENTNTHERCSVKQLAKKIGEESVIPSVIKLWLMPTCWNVRFMTSMVLSSSVIQICVVFSYEMTLRVIHFARTTIWILQRICILQKMM